MTPGRIAWAKARMPLTQAALDQSAMPDAVALALPQTSPTHALTEILADHGCTVDPAASMLGDPAALAQSALYQRFYREIGTGQAAVMAFLDITNLQLAGRSVGVAGFGPEGRGVAATVAALGGRVVIQTSDPVAQNMARAASYRCGGLNRCDVVFATDGFDRDAALRDGVLLCNVGDTPLDIGGLIIGENLRAHVDAAQLDSVTMLLIAGGGPVHHAAADGVPIAVADMAIALHILSFAAGGWTPAIEAQVARWQKDLA